MTDNQKTIFLRKVLTNDEILHMKIKYVALFFLSFTECHILDQVFWRILSFSATHETVL